MPFSITMFIIHVKPFDQLLNRGSINKYYYYIIYICPLGMPRQNQLGTTSINAESTLAFDDISFLTLIFVMDVGSTLC